ncbi:hypothetical protein D3C85_1585360 [compost metagenome]
MRLILNAEGHATAPGIEFRLAGQADDSIHPADSHHRRGVVESDAVLLQVPGNDQLAHFRRTHQAMAHAEAI